MPPAAVPALQALILSDGKPGHYHLAEGVIAALRRRRPVVERRLEVEARRLPPPRVLAVAYARGVLSAAAALRLGYGIDAAAIGRPSLVVSAGGDTVLANAAVARLAGAPNIFCGTLRRLRPEHFALIVSSYERHATRPRTIVTLKPNRLDPDTLGRPAGPAGPTPRPKLVGLLLGGDSGLFSYRDDEWQRLLAFARVYALASGARFLVSTSRRTGAHAAAAAARLARDPTVVARFVDYRDAGPGTLTDIFRDADAILCSEDSSTMISEAVSVRLPVVGAAPEKHAFKPEEAAYRHMLEAKGWCRFLPIAALDVASFDAALAAIVPMTANLADALADEIFARLPQLMES